MLGISQDAKQPESKLLNKDWRIKHLYKIRSKEGHLIRFKRNRAQEELAQNHHTRNIILKARQLGITTDEAIDSFDSTLFEDGFKSLLISYNRESALDIFDNKISFAWGHIPPAIQNLFMVDTERANQMKFEQGKGTKVYSSIAVRTSGRGDTYNRVHVSEFGKICAESPDVAEEILTGTIPTVPLTGRVDIESTAQGNSGYFYEMFMKAWSRGEPKSNAEFKAFFFNWTYEDEQIALEEHSIPYNLPVVLRQYQIEHSLTDQQITYYWKKMESFGLPFDRAWKKMKQEFPTTPEEAFETSGDKLFDAAEVKKDIEVATIYLTDHPLQEYGDWTYFDHYRPNHRYAIGVDVAEGVGRDSSTIVVMDFYEKPYKVVATYASNKVAPDILAYEIKNIAREFGNPLVAVERNNHGHATLVVLKSMYRNLYAEIKDDKIKQNKTERLGWHTNAQSKPKMFYDLKTAINENQFEIYSIPLLREMLSYDKNELNTLKADESQTQHWDLLTAAAICYQMEPHARTTRDKESKNTPKSKEPKDRYSIF